MKGEEDLLKATVGAKIYGVWLDMLRTLVPGGRTHRLAVLVAGILHYAYAVSSNKKANQTRAQHLFELFESALEGQDEGDLQAVVELVEKLFDDAGVLYQRSNRRGEAYSIAAEAVNEFITWKNMSWEE
jgi:hypothetical protein